MRKRGSACADVVPFKLVVAGGAGSKVFESCDRILNDLYIVNLSTGDFKIDRVSAGVHGQMDFRGITGHRLSNAVISFVRSF